MKVKDKLLIILGPTATGKTDLAIDLAKKFNGELVSVDSRQVYKGLDIGTGKITGKVESLKKEEGKWIVDGIVIHMYDIADPRKQYDIAHFINDSKKVISKILKQKKLPILVGGSGYYIKGLSKGFDSLSVPINKTLRKVLEKMTLPALQEKLKSLSLEKWNNLNSSDKQNPRRLIRSIELVSMYPYSNKIKISGLTDNFNILKIGLTASRETLYQRADKGILNRINLGMIKEAQRLRKEGLSLERMKQLGLEYGILADYLEGKIKSEEELIKMLQGKIHGYVRRQLTWFKKEAAVKWFDISTKGHKRLENMVSIWYHEFNGP